MPRLGPAHSNPSMFIAGLTLSSALAITACHDQARDKHPTTTTEDGTGDASALPAEPKMGPPPASLSMTPARAMDAMKQTERTPRADRIGSDDDLGALQAYDGGTTDAAADGQAPSDAGRSQSGETGGTDAGGADGGGVDVGTPDGATR